MFSIGQLSTQTGVKIPTIRYYEQVGLLREPVRSNGNQRRYDRASLERLAFIRHARELGLSIEMIRDLITLSADETMPCARAHEIAALHLKQIRQRIAKLQRMEAELSRIESVCDTGTVGACLVLGAITAADV